MAEYKNVMIICSNLIITSLYQVYNTCSTFSHRCKCSIIMGQNKFYQNHQIASFRELLRTNASELIGINQSLNLIAIPKSFFRRILKFTSKLGKFNIVGQYWSPSFYKCKKLVWVKSLLWRSNFNNKGAWKQWKNNFLCMRNIRF